MTRAGRFFRNLLERFLDRYYEGPSAPTRIEEEVRMFRLYHPDATPDAWERFATALAGNAYRDGFVRGYEWNERDWPGPAIDPEVLAEVESHDWSLAEQDVRVAAAMAEGIDPDDPAGHVPSGERARYLDEVGRQLGTFRVTVDQVGVDPEGRPYLLR